MAAENCAKSSTAWSVIVRARGEGADAQVALGELIRRYDRTVLTLIRRFRLPPGHAAEDLKQEFFVRILERESLQALDPERGRFRGWLHIAVRRFVFGAWRTCRRRPEGYQADTTVDLDTADLVTPEHLYLRAFAEDTMRHALERHRREAANPERFDRLRRFLPGRQMDLVALAPIAASMGLKPAAVAVAVCYMRAKHKAYLREAVAETLHLDPADPSAQSEIDLEMRRMRDLLVDVPDPSPARPSGEASDGPISEPA